MGLPIFVFDNQPTGALATPNHTDEKDLLIRLRDGDAAAFTVLYDRYARRIASKLIGILKSKELSQDILQDVFAKIWDVRDSIDPEQSFSAYLYKIAVNLSSNTFRKSLRETAMRIHIAKRDESYNHIEEAIAIKDQQEILNKALAKLPRKQRDVYILHKIEGLSHKEISEQLGITLSAVNQHIHRASKAIRQTVTPEMGMIFIALSDSLLNG